MNLKSRLERLEIGLQPEDELVDLDSLSDNEREVQFQRELAKLPPLLTGDDIQRLLDRWRPCPPPSLGKVIQQFGQAKEDVNRP